MALKTDYKDDILDSSVNVNRTFSIIDNTTGQIIYPNVSLEETTVFSQEGDSHTSQITNEQNAEINQINESLSELSKNSFGTQIDMTAHSTYATALVAPNDGYIKVFNGTLHIFSADSTSATDTQIRVAFPSLQDVIFIRKGLKLVLDGGGSAGNFTPLV